MNQLDDIITEYYRSLNTLIKSFPDLFQLSFNEFTKKYPFIQSVRFEVSSENDFSEINIDLDFILNPKSEEYEYFKLKELDHCFQIDRISNICDDADLIFKYLTKKYINLHEDIYDDVLSYINEIDELAIDIFGEGIVSISSK